MSSPRAPPARNPSVLKLGAALCGASSEMLCTLALEHDAGAEIYMYREESHALSQLNTPITISQQLPPSPRPTFDVTCTAAIGQGAPAPTCLCSCT
jgi:hypothetical protein